jgi:hypothetical protein
MLVSDKDNTFSLKQNLTGYRVYINFILDYHPLKKGYKWRIDEIGELDIQIERSKNYLH